MVTALLITPLAMFIIFRIFPVFTSSAWQPSWYSGAVNLILYYLSTLAGLLALIIALLLHQGLGMNRNARSVMLAFGFLSLAAFQLVSSLGIPYLLLRHMMHPAFIWSLYLSLPVSSLFFALAGVRWSALAEKRIINRRWYLFLANSIGFLLFLHLVFNYATYLEDIPPILSYLYYLVVFISMMLFIWAAWRTDELSVRENTIMERQLAFTMILLAEAEIYLAFGLPGTLSWMLHQPLLLTALAVTLVPLLKIAVQYQKEKVHRSELTQLIVHDLKSPLTIVISGLELLHRGNLGEISQVQGKLLTNLEHCSNEILRLVDDMLDVERLEDGALKPQKRPQNLASILKEQISGLRILAEKNEQKLTLHMSDNLPLIYFDPDLIRRVIHNLVANALKFTPHGGTISVEATENGTEVVFSVADSGPGIPRQERQRIFEKFAQLDTKTRRGNGLGLTFCQMVVEAHDGNLVVEDTPLGGALFKMTFPISTESPTSEQNTKRIQIV